MNVGGCQDAEWLGKFFEEEEDIGTESFLSLSIGCNKGTDAIHIGRLGLLDSNFDVSTWKQAIAIGNLRDACRGHEQGRINFPKRKGEVHCIESMIENFQLVKKASNLLGFDSKQFVVAHAAISSRDGNVKFPKLTVGTETGQLENCDQLCNSTIQKCCPDVKMYSLDSYVDKFVESIGPIHVLSIDTEGRDFDVLFGASSVLDRTYYVEFEYHGTGMLP